MLCACHALIGDCMPCTNRRFFPVAHVLSQQGAHVVAPLCAGVGGDGLSFVELMVLVCVGGGALGSHLSN